MRFYARTGRRTGVSVGPVGAILLGLLMVALPVYAVEMLFSTWWSAAITLVVVIPVALGWAARRAAARELPRD